MNKKLELNNVYKLDVFDFLNKIENNSIDLAIVDPPYNMNKGDFDTFKTEKDYFDFTFKWIDKLLKKMKKNGTIYLFNNPYNSAIILNHLNKKGIHLKNWITWYKKDDFSATKKRYM